MISWDQTICAVLNSSRILQAEIMKLGVLKK